MARFAVSDSQDQSAAVWILTFLLLSYTTLTTVIRGFVKLKMMGLDDGVASVAQLFTYGYVICIIYALMHGFAKARPQLGADDVRPQYGKALQASIVLYLLTLATAKVTIVSFLRRAFRRANYAHVTMLCNIAMVALSLWGIGAAIAVSVNCGPEHLSQATEVSSCDGNTRWLVVTVLDGVTEIGVLIFTMLLVSQLQMKVAQKFSVVAAFAWRLGLIILAAYHYRSYHRTFQSSNTDIAISKIVIWEQVSICYSLLSITWPFSKAFINNFDTAPLQATSTYGSVATSSRAPKRKSKKDSAEGSRTRPWDNSRAHASAAYSRPIALKRDNDSFGSQEMIIRRDDEVAVTYHSKDPGTR